MTSEYVLAAFVLVAIVGCQDNSSSTDDPNTNTVSTDSLKHAIADDHSSTEQPSKGDRTHAESSQKPGPVLMPETDSIGAVSIKFTYDLGRCSGATATTEDGRLLGTAKVIGWEQSQQVVEETHFSLDRTGTVVYRGRLHFGVLGVAREERLEGRKQFTLFTSWPSL